MIIRKKIRNKIVTINIPSFDGGEFVEQFFEMVWLLSEENDMRLTEDGFERILE
jgi:hypothetical protein